MEKVFVIKTNQEILKLVNEYLNCIHKSPFSKKRRRGRPSKKLSIQKITDSQMIKNALEKIESDYNKFLSDIGSSANSELLQNIRAIYEAKTIYFEDEDKEYISARSQLLEAVEQGFSFDEIGQYLNASSCVNDDRRILRGIVNKKLAA